MATLPVLSGRPEAEPQSCFGMAFPNPENNVQLPSATKTGKPLGGAGPWRYDFRPVRL